MWREDGVELRQRALVGLLLRLLGRLDAVALRRQDLELARAELNALMSIPPGTAYTLADEAEMPLPPVPANIDELELMALESMVWKNAMPTPVASTRAMVDAQSAADDGPYPWVE